MAPRPTTTSTKVQRLHEAIRLAERGDLNLARVAFEQAIALDRRNIDLKYNLALLEEVAGFTDRAAELYTLVLAEKPLHRPGAQSFARLARRFQINDLEKLSRAGLNAALRAADIQLQPIVDVSARWLVTVDPKFRRHGEALERGERGELDIGRALCGRATDACIEDDLLLGCLANGTIRSATVERILTGVRAALLLDCHAGRFEDRAIARLVIALLEHGWRVDHAWAETPAETAALAALTIDRTAVLDGDREATRTFMLSALYRPLSEIVSPPLTADEAHRLRPRSLREVIERQVLTEVERSAASASVASLRPATDATSVQVAGQYERAPYPRWDRLQRSQPGALQRSLTGYYGRERLAFMAKPFDVLIAGCGTGQQALQAADAYGPDARVLAMDLSRTSLGYARAMADRLQISNVSFLQGDILDCHHIDRTFHVVECVGVLHHMADWRVGWRALLTKLRPDGIMYIGLYSAVARQDLMGLRASSDYPGPGCTNAAARVYRRQLMLRDDAAPGGDLKFSANFHALHAFRDLVLHESEVHVALDAVAAFLDAEGLVFRGFTLDSTIVADCLGTGPDQQPGTLADWAAYEARHPRTFDGMYCFWVERRGT